MKTIEQVTLELCAEMGIPRILADALIASAHKRNGLKDSFVPPENEQELKDMLRTEYARWSPADIQRMAAHLARRN